nr:ABC transporter ATP-binding protein [Propionibacterium sp.]
MSQVTLTAVTKAYGRVAALAGVGLDVARGELLAVLGPSGCGKTTLLRSLAGLERIDGGGIEIAGRAVAGPGLHVPAHRRGAALVPQDGALFPHLNVAGNVGFGLGRRPDARRVAEVLELVGLAGLGGRMPHELSGGQQQRVAVGRALAPRPDLILLDEPFSALDAALRAELRHEVRRALRAAGATALLVTHDQGEALSMADRIAVLRGGVLRQVGTPAEVYAEPADAWVAGFVGEANLWPAEPAGPGLYRTPLGPVPAVGSGGVLLLRPERVRLTVTDAAGRLGPDAPGTAGLVEHVAYHGHDALVTVAVPGGRVLARPADAAPAPGAPVRVSATGPGRLVPSGADASVAVRRGS